jgi:hypothetical protein
MDEQQYNQRLQDHEEKENCSKCNGRGLVIFVMLKPDPNNPKGTPIVDKTTPVLCRLCYGVAKVYEEEDEKLFGTRKENS